MFKRMLASVGIGAAQVDLLLHQEAVRAGDTITGIVRIQGGRVNQEVEDVYTFLKTRYLQQLNNSNLLMEATIAKIKLAGKFTVEAERTYELPATIQLPAHTPITLSRTPVWLQTGLEISEGVDPKDEDYLHIRPHPYAATVLEAIDQHGLRLRDASCEYSPHYGRPNGQAFIQKFEFVPGPGSPFRDRLAEVDLILYPREDSINLLLQIDRKTRGLTGLFAEAMNAEERFVQLRFTPEQLASGAGSVADDFAETIRRHIV